MPSFSESSFDLNSFLGEAFSFGEMQEVEKIQFLFVSKINTESLFENNPNISTIHYTSMNIGPLFSQSAINDKVAFGSPVKDNTKLEPGNIKHQFLFFSPI